MLFSEKRKRLVLQVKDGSQQSDEDGDWEYVEEGPAEIIWRGNEIIVKKKRVKVPKKGIKLQSLKEVMQLQTQMPTYVVFQIGMCEDSFCLFSLFYKLTCGLAI